MNFVKQRKNWPAIRARWPVLEKLLIQPETVLIVTIALCLTGCASHRKSMNREVRTESASADSASGSRRADVYKRQVYLFLPVFSLQGGQILRQPTLCGKPLLGFRFRILPGLLGVDMQMCIRDRFTIRPTAVKAPPAEDGITSSPNITYP